MRVFYQQKHYQLGLKGTEMVQNEERPLDPPNSTGSKEAEKSTQLHTHPSFHEKGRRRRRNRESEGESQEPWSTTPMLRPAQTSTLALLWGAVAQ